MQGRIWILQVDAKNIYLTVSYCRSHVVHISYVCVGITFHFGEKIDIIIWLWWKKDYVILTASSSFARAFSLQLWEIESHRYTTPHRRSIPFQKFQVPGWEVCCSLRHSRRQTSAPQHRTMIASLRRRLAPMPRSFTAAATAAARISIQTTHDDVDVDTHRTRSQCNSYAVPLQCREYCKFGGAVAIVRLQ